MKNLIFLLSMLVMFACAGCRFGRYELSEPLDGRAVEVKSGDRISVVLEENGTTGYVWMTECDDDDVTFSRETVPPDDDKNDDKPLCGAPGKVCITMRVHRGFAGPAHVRLIYRRPWKGGETARDINLLLYRKPEDSAPWK